MLIIGLTGGIGSGKTTVSRLFRELGAPIIDTDQIARKLTEPGLPAYDKIVDHFGKAFIAGDKRLNRARLRARVFESKEDRIWLEQLLHPMIIDEIKQQIAALESVSYVIVEIPLLFESQFEHAVNRILVIDAPEQKQVERIMNRDGIPKEAIEAIMNTQISRNHRLSLAHDVILNDSDLLALRDRVVALHHYYNELSNK